MASGARLRSANAAFGRAASGIAFLITAQPPEPPPSTEVVNTQTWKIGTTFGVWGSAADQVPSSSCGAGQTVNCDVLPGWLFADRPYLSEIFPEGDSYLVGLGYEQFPFPAIQLQGVTSGHVVTFPEHCASDGCAWIGTQGSPVDDYASIPGATGAWYAFAGAALASQVRNPDRFWVTYEQALGNPWSFQEDVLITVTNTVNTLYPAGPYNILSVTQHPQFASLSVLNLNLPAPYLTRAAVNITGTGAYDGMQQCLEYPDFSGQTPSQLVLNVPWAGTATGTLLRIYDQDYDSYWNDFFRIMNETPPPLPSPP